jgi:hypothetical protein
MQVALLIDSPISLRNKGIRLKIADNDGHVGYLGIGKASVTWQKSGSPNAKRIRLSSFIEMLNSAPGRTVKGV